MGSFKRALTAHLPGLGALIAVWITGVRLIALKPYSSTAVSMGALYEGSGETFGVAFGVSSIEGPKPGLALCSAKKACSSCDGEMY